MLLASANFRMQWEGRSIASRFRVLFLAGITIACLGCGSGMSGRYVEAGNSASYLEFHTDGTFFANVLTPGYQMQYRTALSGTYRLDGATLTLSTPMGAAEQYQVNGSSVTGNGHTFTKQ